MNHSKFYRAAAAALLCLVTAPCFSGLALGQVALVPATPASSHFAGVGTGTTTLSYFVTTANSSPGVPVFKFIDATSDASNSVCQFYTASSPLLCTDAAAASQAVIAAPGTGNVASNDVIVVRSIVNDTYQRLLVSSVTSTSITATASLSFDLVAGDKVYKMTKAGSFAVGAATKQINANGGIFASPIAGRPVLAEVTGSSACAINLASGVFEK